MSAGVSESGVIRTSLSDLYEVSSRQESCSGMIKCRNSKCVAKDLACDGNNDCGDNTDETECLKPSRVMIRLVGGKGNHEGNIQVR